MAFGVSGAKPRLIRHKTNSAPNIQIPYSLVPKRMRSMPFVNSSPCAIVSNLEAVPPRFRQATKERIEQYGIPALPDVFAYDIECIKAAGKPDQELLGPFAYSVIMQAKQGKEKERVAHLRPRR